LAKRNVPSLTDEQILQALSAYPSKAAAARALRVPVTTFKSAVERLLLKATKNSRTWEEWRNRGTTQLKINEHPTYDLPEDVDLYLTGDWHAGAESCYYAGIRLLANEIESNPLARAIHLGDLMEVQPLDYQDGGRNSDSYIDGQIIRTTHGLQQIRDKLLLTVSGNHGKKRLALAGIDPDLIVSSMLGVRYATVPKVAVLKCGGAPIRVCVGHGKAGGKGDGMPELQHLRNVYPGCAIYALGHNHRLYAKPDGAMRVDDDGKEHWSPSWLCRTGSMLLYAEYARYSIYPPQPVGYLVGVIRGGVLQNVEERKTDVVS